MLQIKEISKQYKTGDLVQTALDGVSLNLRDNEFVAILGPSGSGKTTLLNVIGGLDRYDSGDLIINGVSTKEYKDRDWDSYRNHTIGFVFQSYNLIPHQSVLSNVELALTISGVSRSERRKRAKAALEQVGLGDQLHKRPNQMSGGQMQRVAIARALVNDPDILLADEPTGALDTDTSVQVMELLKEVAKDRLVVMVTHNPELAEQYATRIVKLRDGKILDDSDPYQVDDSKLEPARNENMGRASMSFRTALSLSFNNLRTKKARTFLTAFAGSIGIIGIALILSLSNGVTSYVENLQKSVMVSYPLTIEAQSMDFFSMLAAGKENTDASFAEAEHELDGVYSDASDLERVSSMTTSIKTNNLTAFKQYLDNPNSEIRQYVGENGIIYSYNTQFDVYTYDPEGTFVNTDGSTLTDGSSGGMGMGMPMMGSSTGNDNFEELLPSQNGELVSSAVVDSYDLLYGAWPTSYDEVVLVLDKNNEISATTLYELGILPVSEYKELMQEIEDGEEINVESQRWNYEDICAQELYLIPACDTYVENGDGTFTDVSDSDLELEGLLDSALRLKIVGVIRPAEDADYASIGSAIGYTQALTDYIIDHTNNSAVVKAQEESPDTNVLNGMTFAPQDDAAKVDDTKTYLAGLTVSEKAELCRDILGQVGMSGMNMSSMDMSGMDLSGFDMSGMDMSNFDMSNFDMSGMDRSSFDMSGADMSGAAAGDVDVSAMASMSDSELAEMLDEYLADPEDEVLLSIYDSYIASGSYDGNMEAFGVVSLDAPSAINIYSDSFDDKEAISDCITAYNQTVSEEDQISYTDIVGMMTSSITTIINVISYVLIAFVAVSLIVSSIMIGIITYISVLERTKEIGILRAIGASKRNVSQVFNAETFIVGLFSGLIGIGVTLLLLIPGNAIIHHLTGSFGVSASLPVADAVVLIVLSVILTLIGGLIPSKSAARKDPVAALRTE